MSADAAVQKAIFPRTFLRAEIAAAMSWIAPLPWLIVAGFPIFALVRSISLSLQLETAGAVVWLFGAPTFFAVIGSLLVAHARRHHRATGGAWMCIAGSVTWALIGWAVVLFVHWLGNDIADLFMILAASG